ncbi:hypothetical protein, partial [Halomonas maura]|uniref:hypothetical protein n=1 Tax=Halomonas maura TaxID=117606 RepID=UPI0025B35604
HLRRLAPQAGAAGPALLAAAEAFERLVYAPLAAAERRRLRRRLRRHLRELRRGLPRDTGSGSGAGATGPEVAS